MKYDRIITGDCLKVLPTLPAKSFQMCVCSPPYWGMRDYGAEGQLGSEQQLDCLGWTTGNQCGECFVCHMVRVFQGVHRALRDDGILFINIGDSYGSGRCGGGAVLSNGRTDDRKLSKNDESKQLEARRYLKTRNLRSGLKPKDRNGQPHRVAFALQADGWYWRDEIVWYKPSVLPSSQTDRCTCAHEFVFMFTKKPSYYYDWKAIEEVSDHAPKVSDTFRRTTKEGGLPHGVGKQHRMNRPGDIYGGTRRKRSIWTIPSKPLKEKHFAAFPPRLAETCIKAGTSLKGCCRRCGAPWRRLLEKTRTVTRPGQDTKVCGQSRDTTGHRDPERHVTTSRTVGWEPSCLCGETHTVSCKVLDPFMGAGTTACAAKRLHRNWLGVEINSDFVSMANRRIAKVQMGMVPV